MNKELKINNKDDDEEEEDNFKKLSYIEIDDFNNYKELDNIFSNNDNIINFIIKKEYCKLKKIFEKHSKNYEDQESKDDSLKMNLKNKMKKIFEDYLNIDTYMEIKENIIKNFNE